MAMISAKYIKLFGSDKFLAPGPNNMMLIVKKDSAVRLRLEPSKERADKVVIASFDGNFKLYFESSNKSLKHSADIGTPFEIVLVYKDGGFGFVIKHNKFCLLKKSDSEVIFGECGSKDLLMIAILENTAGTKIDELMLYDKEHRMTPKNDDHVMNELFWSNMSLKDVGELLKPFNRDDCTGECPVNGSRILVKFNKQ